jgi:peptidoglycan biosynthesis protein MviN/MurJ (putative lipid II flippase)
MHILRILAFGQLINMTISAPANSIIPNIGVPKYQMHEGLICLGLNIPLSFLLIKYFGVIGAAYGSVISITISSIYLYFSSLRFFNQKGLTFLRKLILKPNIVSLICAAVIYTAYKLISSDVYPVLGRKSAIIYLASSGILFVLSYTLIIINSKYLDEKDKEIFLKLLHRVIPLKRFKTENNR